MVDGVDSIRMNGFGIKAGVMVASQHTVVGDTQKSKFNVGAVPRVRNACSIEKKCLA